MSGAYLRVKRDGKWQPIEVEHLTKEELEGQFLTRPPEELVRWIAMLCTTIREIDEAIQRAEKAEGKEAQS